MSKVGSIDNRQPLTLLDWLVFIARLVLGVVFIYASYDKILEPAAFARNVENYRFLPYQLVNIFAIILPWLELICGILLILGVYVEAAAGIIGILLVMFIIAISHALLRGIDISCGCFKTGQGKKIGTDLLVRDIVLLAFCVGITLCDRAVLGVEHLFRRRKNRHYSPEGSD